MKELVNRLILWEGAQKKGVIASAEEKEEALNSVKNRFNSVEEFTEAITMQGMNVTEFSQFLEKQIVISQYIRQSLRSSSVH